MFSLGAEVIGDFSFGVVFFASKIWYFFKRIYIQPENKGYDRHIVVIVWLCFQFNCIFYLYVYFKDIS